MTKTTSPLNSPSESSTDHATAECRSYPQTKQNPAAENHDGELTTTNNPEGAFMLPQPVPTPQVTPDRAARLTSILAGAPRVDQASRDEILAYAHALQAEGLALLPVHKGGKNPAINHGVHAATTDPAALDAAYKQGCNLGVNLGASNLIVVDADTPEEVGSWKAWQEEHGLGPQGPTVTTPGTAAGHKEGGHWWIDAAGAPGELKKTKVGTATAMANDSYVLLPGSVRTNVADPKHPAYVTVGNVVNAATGHAVISTVAKAAAKQTKHTQRGEDDDLFATHTDADNDDITRWAEATGWATLLEPDGWTDTGRTDSCGCPVYTAPGTHGSWRSATAHDACATANNGGALTIWTENPPTELEDTLARGKRISKFEYITFTHFAGDASAAAAEVHDKLNEIDMNAAVQHMDTDTQTGEPAGAATAPAKKHARLHDWEQATDWDTILAGQDALTSSSKGSAPTAASQLSSPTSGAYTLLDEADNGTKRWAPTDNEDTDAVLVTSGDRIRLEDPTTKLPPVWWPVSEPHTDKLTAYAGVREINRATAAQRLHINEEDVINSFAWFFNHQGLDAIHTASKMRGVNPWGTLGAAVTRINADIDPRVTLNTAKWGKGTLNLFTVLCGEPGSGKGITQQLARDLIQRGTHNNYALAGIDNLAQKPVGSPEAMALALAAQELDTNDDDDENANKPLMEPLLRRVLFSADEMTRVYGERRSQESTQEGVLLSMWSNENLGALRKREQDNIDVDAWTYRACFIASAQAKWVHRLAGETSAGLAQRWLYMPAGSTEVQRPHRGDLQRSGGSSSSTLPVVRVPERVWAAKKSVEVDAEVQFLMMLQAALLRQAESNGQGVDPFAVHRAYNQLRVAAAIHVLTTGRLGVEPAAWHLAAVVMDVSDLTRMRMTRLYEGTARREKVDAAVDKAAVQDDALMQRVKERSMKVLGRNPEGLSWAALRREITFKQREVMGPALAELLSVGAVCKEDVVVKGEVQSTLYKLPAM